MKNIRYYPRCQNNWKLYFWVTWWHKALVKEATLKLNHQHFITWKRSIWGKFQITKNISILWTMIYKNEFFVPFFPFYGPHHRRYLVSLTLWLFSGSGLCEEKSLILGRRLFSFWSVFIHVFIHQASCFEHCSRCWGNSDGQDQVSTLKELNLESSGERQCVQQ